MIFLIKNTHCTRISYMVCIILEQFLWIYTALCINPMIAFSPKKILYPEVFLFVFIHLYIVKVLYDYDKDEQYRA